MTTSEANKVARYEWVDAFRFLGILAVYLGHLMRSAGKLFPFVYVYHVPLFFLAAGFFAPKSAEQPFLESVKKRFFTLVIPYVGFSILNILVTVIIENGNGWSFYLMLKQTFFGVRGEMTFAWALWFLPCLFVIAVLFDILYRVMRRFRNGLLLVLCISLVIHVITASSLPYVERFIAKWFFSIDSALYYLFFYAFGAFIFPLIKDKKFSDFSTQGRFEFIVFTGIALFVSGYLYFSEAGFKILALPMEPSPYFDILSAIVKTLFVIYVNFVLAHFLTRIEIIPKLGQNTLIYCGTEDILKKTVTGFLSTVRLGLTLPNPYMTFVYTVLLLFLSHFTIVPFVNKYLILLSGKYSPATKVEEPATDTPVFINRL